MFARLALFAALLTSAPLLFAQPADDGELARLQTRALAHAKQLRAVLEGERSQPDATRLQTQVVSLGKDPRKLYDFVAKQVAFEPYRGSLRGARGALVSRAGNALDQAQLLHALLKAAGLESRIVRGSLSAEQARALVDRFLASQPLEGVLAAYRQPAKPGSAEPLRALAAKLGLDADALEAAAKARQQAAAEGQRAFDAVVDRELGHLTEALEGAGLKLGQPHADRVAALVEASRQHAWVELEQNKRWIALDPAHGEAWGTRAGEPTDAAPLAKLTDADRHQLRFRLIYRRKTGRKVEEVELLSVPLYGDEALDRQALFTIVPTAGKPPLFDKPPTRKDAERFLLRPKRCQAILQVGDTLHGSLAFDLAGGIFEVSRKGQLIEPKRAGAMLGPFGGGGRGPKHTFLELVAELTLSGPGRPVATQRRRLISPQDTRGKDRLSPLLTWELLLQGGLLDLELLRHPTIERNLMSLDLTEAAIAGRSLKEVLDLTGKRPAAAQPWTLLNFVVARQRQLARMLKGGAALPYWAGLNLFVVERRPCVCKLGGAPCSKLTIDLVDNGVRFVGRDAKARPALAALRLGVIDTVLEVQVIAGQAPVTATAASFDKAREAGAELLVLDPKGDLAKAAIAADDRAWIAAHEPAARRLIAPSKGGDGFWWSVDLEHGTVVGRGPGGRGAGMTERSLLEKVASFYKMHLRLHGAVLSAFYCMATLVVDAAMGDPKTQAARFLWKTIYCLYQANYGLAVGLGQWDPMGWGQFAAWMAADYAIGFALGGKGPMGALFDHLTK